MSCDDSHKERQFIVASFFFSRLKVCDPYQHYRPTCLLREGSSEILNGEKGKRIVVWKGKVDKQMAGDERREDAIVKIEKIRSNAMRYNRR